MESTTLSKVQRLGVGVNIQLPNLPRLFHTKIYVCTYKLKNQRWRIDSVWLRVSRRSARQTELSIYIYLKNLYSITEFITAFPHEYMYVYIYIYIYREKTLKFLNNWVHCFLFEKSKNNIIYLVFISKLYNHGNFCCKEKFNVWVWASYK